jgi:hypothetical protein
MTPEREYPPLPLVLDGLGGPVQVVVGPRPEGTDKQCIGEFSSSERRIWILETLSPLVQWTTLFHETVHVAIYDTGLQNILSGKKQEAICDALATARVREQFGYRQDPEMVL